jgi:hypothetical protein
MPNPQKIKYASIDIMSTYPVITGGTLQFRQSLKNHILKDFLVPHHIQNEPELKQYFNELLYKSDFDVASVDNVYVHEWNTH